MTEPRFDVPLVGTMPEQRRPDGFDWPKLRLHHLFALTTVMAVVLGVSGPQYDFGSQASELPQLMRVAMLGWGILYSILASVAITVVAYGIAWRRQGLRFFDQPGHWLMVEIAVTTVSGLLPQLAFRAMSGLRSSGDVEVPWTMLTVITITSLAFLVFRVTLNIYLGIKKCRERRWRWVFYLKAAATILQFFGDLLVLAMISRASLIDRRQGVSRDVGHRCGVAVQIGLSALTIFFTVLIILSFALGWWRLR